MSALQSHGESSEGEYEDEMTMPEAHWQTQQQTSVLSSAPLDSSLVTKNQPSTPARMQKRRRVTRACDECRRKKIKCDAKQPCTHCTVYSYDCTYDQPSNRKRNPAPQYVESLEKRLQRAEALLKTVLPDVNLEDPNFDTAVPQRMNNPIKYETQALPSGQARPWAPLEKHEQRPSQEKDPMLESMVTNTGSLDLDDEGYWDFHGHSSGRIFLRRMRDQFGDLMGKPDAMPELNYTRLSQHTEPVSSPKVSANTPMDPSVPKTHDLPAKRCALLLSGNALDDAGAIIRVVHQPSYYVMLHRIYDMSYEEFGDKEHKFLPLLYGVLALGALFARAEQSELQTNGYEHALDQGYHWHRVSRSMIEVTDCRDLTSLQILLYLILFLQCSARLSTCYSYIGIALRSAIRMGLHRSVSNVFNPVETELRKRIFWIVRKLDIYVGALLGLPQMLSNDDIDQEMPLEIDDEYITTEKILPMPPGNLSLFTALNGHTRLVEILAKTMKFIYPIKGNHHSRGKTSDSYVVSHASIREIEQDLQHWMEALPMQFRPGEEAPPEFMRIRHLLRMAYAHIQLVLYRPFLHYVSQSYRAKNIDRRSYACAAACVSVSRNTVHLTGQMKRRGLLVGSYWFYMYTTFFAIISLVFYILENPQSPEVEEILKDAYEGRDTLAALAAKSLAADRCSRTLTVSTELFEQLPGKLQEVRNATSQKKQPAPSSHSTPQPQKLHSAQPHTSRTMASSQPNNTGLEDGLSPTNHSSWQRASVPYDPLSLRHHIPPSIDLDYGRVPQDPYRPSNLNNAGMQSPHSRSSPQPSSATQSVYSLRNPFSGQSIPDLSALMFPSADPFVYPNQPMTTLESRQSIKDENSLDSSIFNLPGPTTTSAPYENVDAQIYGHSRPFLMQGQQPRYVQDVNQSIGLDSTNNIASSRSMQENNVGGWPQQQQQFDQLFGEDWGGWMNQGYR